MNEVEGITESEKNARSRTRLLLQLLSRRKRQAMSAPMCEIQHLNTEARKSGTKTHFSAYLSDPHELMNI
jgi:hypothetical protein